MAAEIAAAAASAATIVQLVDFAGRALKCTTQFLSALVDASKELKSLHNKTNQLEAIFKHTRVLASSYQNSKLGISPESKSTLDLLGTALTICAIDLREIQEAVQKPLDTAGSSLVRLKRRAKHVLDENKLSKLSLRLDGDMAFINGLLSCLAINSAATSQVSVKNQLNDLKMDGRRGFSILESKIGQLSNNIRKADGSRAMSIAVLTGGNTQLYNQGSLPKAISASTGNSNSLQFLSNASISGECYLQALELLGPIVREAFADLYREQHIHFSKEAVAWLMAQLHGLLSEIYAATTKAYTDSLEIEPNTIVSNEVSGIELPRRFRNQVIIKTGTESVGRSSDGSLARKSPSIVSSVDAEDTNKLHYHHHYSGSTGSLHTYFDSCNNINRNKPQRFVRVAISFIPKRGKCCLPGVAFAGCRVQRYNTEGYDNVITAFNVIPKGAPIIRDVQSGDLGVSQVLKRLKAQEAWAGDRDEYGRSLLSYAVETKSRDMVALLCRMGADPQDVGNIEELDFAAIRNRLAQNLVKLQDFNTGRLES